MLGNMQILTRENLWNAAVERRMAERAQKEGADEKANFALDAVDVQAAKLVLETLWHNARLRTLEYRGGWTLEQFAAMKLVYRPEEKDMLSLLTKAVDSFVTLGAISRKHHFMGIRTRDFDNGRLPFRILGDPQKKWDFFSILQGIDSADLLWLMAMERMDPAQYLRVAAARPNLPSYYYAESVQFYMSNVRFADLFRYLEAYIHFAHDHPQPWMTPDFYMKLTTGIAERIAGALDKDEKENHPLLTTQADGYRLHDIYETYKGQETEATAEHFKKNFGSTVKSAAQHVQEKKAQLVDPAKVDWREHWLHAAQTAKLLTAWKDIIPKQWENKMWRLNLGRDSAADADPRFDDAYRPFRMVKVETAKRTARPAKLRGVVAQIRRRIERHSK